MKTVIGMLAFLTPAVIFGAKTWAQEPEPAPPAPAVENVIVTAPRLRPEKALDNFIIAHAASSPALDKIARWQTGICPLTLGLPAKFNRYVTERIVRVAMTAGAPLIPANPADPIFLSSPRRGRRSCWTLCVPSVRHCWAFTTNHGR